MTATSYSVQVTFTSAGGATVYNLTTAQGDDVPGNVSAQYGLADPLTITQRIADSPFGILAHPEPDEATLSIIAPDSTTYADLDLGDPVSVLVYPAASYAGTPVAFYGRVAALAAEPHPLGVRLSVDCVDYTADLAELQVGGAGNYPLEDVPTRLQRITDEAGLPAFPFLTTGLSIGTPKVAARSASWTDAYSLLRQTLDAGSSTSWRDPVTGAALPQGSPAHLAAFRTYIVPNITSGLLDSTTPFSFRRGGIWARRVQYAPPARLTNASGTYGVTVAAADSSPSTGAPIIAASRVTFAPTFIQSKGGGLPNVTVGQDAQGNRYTWDWRREEGWATGGGIIMGGRLLPYSPGLPAGGGPPLVQELEFIIDQTDAGSGPSPSRLVQDYRVPFRPSSGADWNVGTMLWQLWAEPSGWARPELTQLLTVAGAVAGKLPNNREWLAGLVTGTRLVIQKGRPAMELDVAPVSLDYVANREQLGSSLGVASMDSPVLTGITLAQLKARDTLGDYMLVRGS